MSTTTTTATATTTTTTTTRSWDGLDIRHTQMPGSTMQQLESNDAIVLGEQRCVLSQSRVVPVFFGGKE